MATIKEQTGPFSQSHHYFFCDSSRYLSMKSKADFEAIGFRDVSFSSNSIREPELALKAFQGGSLVLR